MSKLLTSIRLIRNEGFGKTASFVAEKIKFGRKIHYFLSHDELCRSHRDDPDNWYDYAETRNRLNNFVSSLPEYQSNNMQTKIVWWCWLQGEKNAPETCRECLESVRNHFADYEINVISERNFERFVKIPSYILEKYHDGSITHGDLSDILRALLLTKYGGIWIDCDVYCTGRDDHLLSLPLFAYKNWNYNRTEATVSEKFILSARKGEPIIHTTLDLLLEYWQKERICNSKYLFLILFHIAANRYSKEWKAVPDISFIPSYYLQHELDRKPTEKRLAQIQRAADFHKLSYKQGKIEQRIVEYFQHSHGMC